MRHRLKVIRPRVGWLFSPLSMAICLMIYSEVAYADINHDALRYEDTLSNGAGVDGALSAGFIPDAGGLRAQAAGNLTSNCVGLPIPAGAAFNGWRFMDAEFADLAGHDVSIEITDCDGAILQIFEPINGCNSFDLSAIAATDIRIVMRVNAVNAAPLPFIEFWNLHGDTTGLVGTELVHLTGPGPVHVNTVHTFQIPIESTGADLRNVVVDVDLDDMNARPYLLATDARKDYGDGFGDVARRPIQFRDASAWLGQVAPR